MHKLDKLPMSHKDWIVALMRVRSPEDEPTKADKQMLMMIQHSLKEIASPASNNDFKKVCPTCGSNKTIKANSVGDRICKQCSTIYEGKPIQKS